MGHLPPIAGALPSKPIPDNDLIFRRIIFRPETNALWYTICSPDGRMKLAEAERWAMALSISAAAVMLPRFDLHGVRSGAEADHRARGSGVPASLHGDFG